MDGGKVLLMGGSYFIGRTFAIGCASAGGWELTALNRGNAPLDLPGVDEIRCDRHDAGRMAGLLRGLEFDAVVDFCAYDPGDISPVVEALGSRAGQYIYLSSASVYENADHAMRREGDRVLYSSDDPMVSEHVCGKALLERELAAACDAAGIPCTIVRPALVYGPYDYAPRERWYIGKIMRGDPVPVLSDGSAKFSLVYVGDVARALMDFIGDERAYGQTFNLSCDERITENLFVGELERLHGPFEKREYTIAEAMNRNVAIPWPLIADELYDGSRYSEAFGRAYTPFAQGMAQTYVWFARAYGA